MPNDPLNRFSQHEQRKAAAPKVESKPEPKRFANEWRKDTIPPDATPVAVAEAKQAFMSQRDSIVSGAEKADAIRRLEVEFGTIQNGVKRLAPGTEITLDMFRHTGLRDQIFYAVQADAEARQTEDARTAYRELTATMSTQQLNDLWTGTAIELIQSQGLPNDFFSWGNNWNWQTFVQACRGLNGLSEQEVPAADEALKAHQYCLSHNHYFDRAEYKRSEQHLRRAVTGFSMPEPVPVDAHEKSFVELQNEVRSSYRQSKPQWGG